MIKVWDEINGKEIKISNKRKRKTFKVKFEETIIHSCKVKAYSPEEARDMVNDTFPNDAFELVHTWNVFEIRDADGKIIFTR